MGAIEEWKDYDDTYLVSSDGIVYNKKKMTICKERTNKIGYCYVSIHGKSVGVHRIIAMTFIPNPENKPTVNHKDANKSNNSVENLEWATYQEQMDHVRKHNLHPRIKTCCKLDQDKNIIKIYDSFILAAEDNGTDESSIRFCCKGWKNSSYGILFRYYDKALNVYIKTKFDEAEYNWICTSKRKIKCIDNGKIYNSQMEASRDLGCSQSSISENLKHQAKTKYSFIYIEE